MNDQVIEVEKKVDKQPRLSVAKVKEEQDQKIVNLERQIVGLRGDIDRLSQVLESTVKMQQNNINKVKRNHVVISKCLADMGRRFGIKRDHFISLGLPL